MILSALVLLAGAAWSAAQAATAITFGITSATAFSLAHYVATEKKYYEAEDLNVDTIVAGAAVGVLQQLAAGSLNIGAGRDRSVAARHPARRADPDRRRRRLQCAVPPGRRQDHQELERSQGQDHQRRRPDRRDALFPAGDGAQERPRRPGLRPALRRRHAQPLRAARVGGGGGRDPDQSGRLLGARAGLRRSRQRAAIPAELGAEQHPRRHPLGAAAPRRGARLPARPHQGDEIHLRAAPIATRSSPSWPSTRRPTPQVAAGHLRPLHQAAGDRAARPRCSRTASRRTSTRSSPWAISPRRRRSTASSTGASSPKRQARTSKP